MNRLAAGVAVWCLWAALAEAQVPEAAPPVDPAAAAGTCIDTVPPVISLGFPSRYKAGSKNRSDFDKAGNDAVNAALKPVDGFISDLVRLSNSALTNSALTNSALTNTALTATSTAATSTAGTTVEPAAQTDTQTAGETPAEAARAAADCAVDRLHDWAAADALSDLQSDGARLSVPGRIAGFAIAYASVRPLSTQDDRQAVIEAWLGTRARDAMTFFDTKAPPRASRNNLRAWAALGAAQVGLILADPVLMDWAASSIRLVACAANADGSLPNEMWRGKLAVHYQIHAVSPLVVGAALLATDRPGLFQDCDAAVIRVARFAVAAAQNPRLAEPHAGVPQSFDPDPAKLRAFEFAWITAFLSQVDDPGIATFAEQFGILSNSKLGGTQSLLWN